MNTIERACGRWQEILPQLGIDTRFLRNKHGPCPICGGKDRFRFDDRDGSGSYYCNQCGPGPGLVLIRKLKRWDHATACSAIDKIIGTNRDTGQWPAPNPATKDRVGRDAAIRRLLREADNPNVAANYLARRGVAVRSPIIRGHRWCPYYSDEDHALIGRFPALRWELNSIHDQFAVPQEEWPHMILVMCWIVYRLGDERPAEDARCTCQKHLHDCSSRLVSACARQTRQEHRF